MADKIIAVYIMTNKRRTLYTGVTSDLLRRVYEHKFLQINGYTSRFNLTILAYYESFVSMHEAIAWEKHLKGWLRVKKLALIIEEQNPH